MKKFIGGAVLLFLTLFISPKAQENFIDIFHSKISQIVHGTVEKFDTFFADPRIKEETKAYIRLRAGFRYETVPDFQKIQKIDFKIRLAKIEKHLGLFVKSYRDRITRREEEEPLDISQENKDAVSVGVEHSSKVRKILKHRFSLGITSSPKIYARYDIYNIPVIYKRWEITVYQRFRAERRLTQNRLEETTQIYIDRLIAPETVWRIYLDRYKVSNISHQTLNYYTSIRTLKKMWKKPLAVEMLAGITQSRLINGSVSLYTIQSRFRLNFYKRWAFFNVYTGTNWHRERGFKGTPFIYVFFEFYFGKR